MMTITMAITAIREQPVQRRGVNIVCRPGEGIWNFYVERLVAFLLLIFASIPQPRTRQRKKTKLNEDIVRHKTASSAMS